MYCGDLRSKRPQRSIFLRLLVLLKKKRYQKEKNSSEIF